MANVIGRPIEEFVEEQIKDRQKISGAGYDSGIAKTPSVINYLNNRNAWIKLASGVSLKNSSGGDLYEDGGQRLKDLQKFSTDNYFTNQDIASLKGKNLAKQYVLFNTVQSLEGNSYSSRSGVRNTNSWSNSQNTLYGGMGSNTRGLQPVPGIIDVSIDTLNRGSIKKATIKLKAFNKFQFGIIEILYLRLGYIMMLEYGWDKYVEGFDANNSPIINNMGDTIIEKEWFKDKSFSQRAMLNVINRYVGKFKGNYNGFFGKVSNFKWDLNKDNTYDISITLISLGSVIESLQVQIPQPIGTGVSSIESLGELATFLNKEYSSEDEGPFGIKKSEGKDDFTIENIGDALGSDKISQFLSDAVINTPKYISSGNTDYFYWPLFAAVANYSDSKGNDADPKVQEFRDDLAKDPSLLSIKTISATHQFYNSVPLKYRFYVRLGKLLDFIENTIVGTVNNDTEYSSRLEIDTDIEGNICTYVNNLVSLDPRIAFFSPSFQDIEGTDEILFDPRPLYINRPDIYPLSLLEPFAVTKDVGNRRAVSYGQIMNIYLNLDFINNTLKDNIDATGKVDLYSFLEGLCQGINKTTGNSTQLSPAIRNGNIVYILEENPIPGYGLVDPSYNRQANPFNLFGYRDNGTANFVQDFKFTTKISPKLMNQISIGAAAGGYSNATNAIGYNWWNRGLINRFEEKYDVEESDSDNRNEDESLWKYFKENATTVRDFNNFGYKLEYLGRTMTFRRLDFCSDTVRRKWEKEKNFKSRCLKRYVLKWMKKTKRVVTALDSVDPRKKAILNYNEYLASAFSFINSAKLRTRTSAFTKDTINLANDASKGTYVAMESSGVDRGINSFNDYLVAYDKILFEEDKINTGQTGFIPVDLSLTSDGLSGIRIYNKLEVNQRELPASYPSSLNFVITGIKDKISNNLWTTELNTISQPPVTSGLPRSISVGAGNVDLASTPGTPSLADLEKQLVANNIPTESLIAKHPLTTGQTANASNPKGRGIIYYAEETPKTQVVLHHTAGRSSIRQEINEWRKSSDHIATHFIIEPDGAFDQLFDLKYWANHLGKMPLTDMKATKSKLDLQKSSISIELVSLGWFDEAIESDGDVIFPQGNKNYFIQDVLPLVRGSNVDSITSPVNQAIYQQYGTGEDALQQIVKPKSQNLYRRVIEPIRQYKGYQYFQGYTFAQITSLFKILEQIKEAYPNIPIIYKPESSDNGIEKSSQWKATVKQYYNMFPQDMTSNGPWRSSHTQFREFYEKGVYYVKGNKKSTKYYYSQDAVNGVPGIYTHNSYRPGKVDVIPTLPLIRPFLSNKLTSLKPNPGNGIFKSKNLTVVSTTSNVQGSINTDPNAIISD
jgi:hypothetical protein